jgi:hypothetical protein
VIAWVDATADVHCMEALAFADHVVGYTIAPSPCVRGGEFGGAVVPRCRVNGWECEIEDRGEPSRGTLDCVEADRDRRMRLTAFYSLADRPEAWEASSQPVEPGDAETAYRRLHLTCREFPLGELADGYETAVDRDAVIAAVGAIVDGDADARGCADGFRARDLLARVDRGYLDSSG